MGEHTHDHNCDCGCNHDEEEMQVTLELEDGTPLVCDVLAIYPVDDDQYIALSPANDEDSEDVFFFRMEEISGEPDEYELVDLDEDETETAGEAFNDLLEHWDDDEEE